MRHKVSGKKLNRSTNHRRSLIKTQLQQLIHEEKLTTTDAKAKVIKKKIEKLINKAKTNSLHMHRQLSARLFATSAVKKLVKDIAPRYKGQTGGFVTLTRVKKRRGDNTLLVKLELKKAEEKDQKKEKGKSKK